MLRRSIGAVLVAAMLVLPGCLPGSKAPLKVDLYTLDYAPEVQKCKPVDEVIRIARFSVAQSYNTNAMVYKQDAYKMGLYNYHKWRTNPADLITDFLARDFRNSGLFHAVFSYRQPDTSRFLIEGGIEEFVESRDIDGWKAVLRLQVTLIDLNQPEVTSRVMFQKRYQMAEAIGDKSPEAFARGMSGAMSKVSAQVIQDVHNGVRSRITQTNR